MIPADTTIVVPSSMLNQKHDRDRFHTTTGVGHSARYLFIYRGFPRRPIAVGDGESRDAATPPWGLTTPRSSPSPGGWDCVGGRSGRRPPPLFRGERRRPVPTGRLRPPQRGEKGEGKRERGRKSESPANKCSQERSDRGPRPSPDQVVASAP